MPNWCVGTWRLKGKVEDILNFFSKELLTREYERQLEDIKIKREALKIEHDKKDKYIYIDASRKEFFINNIRRGYTDDLCIEFEYEELEDIVCVAFDVHKAWGYIPEDIKSLKSMLSKYSLDFRLTAYESGMQFAQEIEIIDGEVNRYVDFTYDDYTWDCESPLLGG